jgi:hypothetical protein
MSLTVLAGSGWPQSIWSSWWSLVFVGVLYAARFAWIVLTEHRDPPEPAPQTDGENPR